MRVSSRNHQSLAAAALAAAAIAGGGLALQPAEAAASNGTQEAVRLCQHTFNAIKASYRAPVSWQIKAALASGACGWTIGTIIGHRNVEWICSTSGKPAWRGGGIARFVVRVVTSGHYDRC